MDLEQLIKETLEQMLIRIGTEFKEISVEKEDDKTYAVDIKSEEASTLIGRHGETIQSLQHLVKVIIWAKTQASSDHTIIIDVDGYRKRQKESIITLAERKVDFVRKTRRAQSLPPMSPFFRRIVHIRLMEPGFDDIETISEGEGEMRHIIIKLKND